MASTIRENTFVPPKELICINITKTIFMYLEVSVVRYKKVHLKRPQKMIDAHLLNSSYNTVHMGITIRMNRINNSHIGGPSYEACLYRLRSTSLSFNCYRFGSRICTQQQVFGWQQKCWYWSSRNTIFIKERVHSSCIKQCKIMQNLSCNFSFYHIHSKCTKVFYTPPPLSM